MSEGGPEYDPKGGTGDFERRLDAARGRRVAPGAAKPESGPSPWSIGGRVGVELLSALVVGVGIGWALDRWLHTTPLFLVAGVLLGGAGGVANVWRLMAPKSATPADGTKSATPADGTKSATPADGKERDRG